MKNCIIMAKERFQKMDDPNKTIPPRRPHAEFVGDAQTMPGKRERKPDDGNEKRFRIKMLQLFFIRGLEKTPKDAKVEYPGRKEL